jgi:phosphoadenosine phosphosulfate reductase
MSTTLDELAERSAAFETAHPREVVAWVWERYGSGAALTSSFEDAVLLDIVAEAAPQLPVVFLDTQYHFAETWWYLEQLQGRYHLNLEIVRPRPEVQPDNRWQLDVEGCCGVRKVEPLERALAGRAAWLTGVRRVDGPTRANSPILSWEPKRQLVKVNPLATWSDDDMESYIAERGLLRHPLTDKGYASIGCWPCTRPVAPGEDRRAGRWSGLEKTECGLHL